MTRVQPPLQVDPPEQMCIVRLSAIGDCCHTVPIVRSIQSAWPDTKIVWIVGRTEYGLLQGMDGVEFVVFDKGAGLDGYRHVRDQLKTRRFPILLHMHPSMRANFVSRCVSADLRIGFDRARAKDYQWLFSNEKIPARTGQHVMDSLFGFTEHIGIPRKELRWDIPLSESDREFAGKVAEKLGRLCVISPCSSQRFRNFRNWSAENYAALATYLHQRHDAHIVLTGGPTDQERKIGAEIDANVGFAVTNLIGKTSLKELMAVLEQAELLICPDSGPAHMATAVRTPVVGLYATTNRHRAAPYFSQQLVADRYPDAVQKEFGKSVSDVRWGTRVRDPSAMNLITLEDVTAKVDLALGDTIDRTVV